MNHNDTLCPICESGTYTETSSITDGLVCYYCVCNSCKSEFAGAEQLRKNKAAFLQFQNKTSKELNYAK